MRAWIFGYGSIIWKPGFEHSKTVVGHIRGYSRKFYQGSNFHRGRPNKLGRVVTLIREEEGSTWGQAFLAKDVEVASTHLTQREISKGGYSHVVTLFYPRDPNEKPFHVVVFIAEPDNPLYLGSGPISNLAHDIATSEGECGHNVEYLSKLVAFMKVELPSVHDKHLDELEKEVKHILSSNNSSIIQLFTEAINEWISFPTVRTIAEEQTSEQVKDDGIVEVAPFDFFSSVSKRKSRCVNKF